MLSFRSPTFQSTQSLKLGSRKKKAFLIILLVAQDQTAHFLAGVQSRRKGEKRKGCSPSLCIPEIPLLLKNQNPEIPWLSKLLISAISLERSQRCTSFAGHQRSVFAISELSGSARTGQVGLLLLGASTIPPGHGFGVVSACAYKPAAPFPTNEQFLRKVKEKSRFSLRARAT